VFPARRKNELSGWPGARRPLRCGAVQKLTVNEIYQSVQGESTWAGLPCVFVRLTFCDLRCTYCDTEYAFYEGKKMTLAEIVEEVRGFLSEDVAEAFDEVIRSREAQGLKVEAEFNGVREVVLEEAGFDRDTGEAELIVRFVSELTSVVRNAEGEIVEGNPREIKRQRDVWSFARTMGADDPNWRLVATGG